MAAKQTKRPDDSESAFARLAETLSKDPRVDDRGTRRSDGSRLRTAGQPALVTVRLISTRCSLPDVSGWDPSSDRCTAGHDSRTLPIQDGGQETEATLPRTPHVGRST